MILPVMTSECPVELRAMGRVGPIWTDVASLAGALAVELGVSEGAEWSDP
jgi:hypothetical protein